MSSEKAAAGGPLIGGSLTRGLQRCPAAYVQYGYAGSYR
jgi:hypothetical protein